MILVYAILFICFEAIIEGLLKRSGKLDFIFKWWLQWIIAIGLFAVWFFALALPFDDHYVPTWKLILGFIGVRFLLFDFLYNLANGQRWDYYGNKTYDAIMIELGSWGLMMKIICGIIGIIFLLGKS